MMYSRSIAICVCASFGRMRLANHSLMFHFASRFEPQQNGSFARSSIGTMSIGKPAKSSRRCIAMKSPNMLLTISWPPSSYHWRLNVCIVPQSEVGSTLVMFPSVMFTPVRLACSSHVRSLTTARKRKAVNTVLNT